MRSFSLFMLALLLLTSCKSQQLFNVEIKEPEFNIVSILILQADLVNTRFETVLRVNNPNVFAVELSSISYKLYGNGLLWSEGNESDILQIPALDSCETRFVFSMNFINMNRRLLDDVITMRRVNYRFTGEAAVKPGVTRLPPFTINFDCSGLSEVRQRSD